MENLKNKTAIIVGGTSGIGRATTEQLLANGTVVHILGRNTRKVADTPDLHKHQVDITDPDDVKQFIGVLPNLGRIDFLVNASGIFGPKPFLEHTAEDYDSYLDLNRGFFFITQAEIHVTSSFVCQRMTFELFNRSVKCLNRFVFHPIFFQ